MRSRLPLVASDFAISAAVYTYFTVLKCSRHPKNDQGPAGDRVHPAGGQQDHHLQRPGLGRHARQARRLSEVIKHDNIPVLNLTESSLVKRCMGKALICWIPIRSAGNSVN